LPLDLTAATDQSLLEQIRRQDEDAFRVLLERHEDRLFGLLYRMLGRREEARDLAQDIFLELWISPERYRPTAEFTTWLYRVALNRAISRLRRRKLLDILSLSPSRDWPDPPASESDRPDHRAEASDFQSRLTAELARLPARQRAALHLRYIDSLSVQATAEALGVSLKSAESLIFRAKVTLRRRLGEA